MRPVSLISVVLLLLAGGCTSSGGASPSARIDPYSGVPDDFSLDSCSAQGKNPALEFPALGHQGMRGHMAPKLRVHQASPINKEKIRLKSSESK